MLHGQELDDAYPPLAVPQDEVLPDAADDRDDVVYQSGLKVAATIRRETADHGRKKKMSPNAERSFEEVALVHDHDNDYDYDYNYDKEEPEQEHARSKSQSKGVQDEEEHFNRVEGDTGLQKATLHESSLGRRRSVCGGPVSEALPGWEEHPSKALKNSPGALQEDVEGSELPICCVDYFASVSRARPVPLGSRRLPADTVASSGIPSLH